MPIWGGSKSYIVDETSVFEETECVAAFSKNPREIATGVSIPLPTIDEGCSGVALQEAQERAPVAPPAVQTVSSRRMFAFGSSRDEHSIAAAACREYRDSVIGQLLEKPYITTSAKSYFSAASRAIQRQEARWQGRDSSRFAERILFWVLICLMEAVVVLPNVVSIKLSAEIAFLRGAPGALQNQLIVLGLIDFQWADARLAFAIGRQCFLGIYPTLIVGLIAMCSPTISKVGLSGPASITWKALISIAWQMLMHNGKSIYDFYYKMRIRGERLTSPEKDEIRVLQSDLIEYSSVLYKWLDGFTLSNRLGAQVSNYKKDHEDILTAIDWLLHERPRGRESSVGKSVILIGVIFIGSITCVSAFPVDAYAGLIACAYFIPLGFRIAVDVWDESQGLDDVVRVFCNTAGPSFPSTILMVINLAYWLATKKPLFNGFVGVSFWMTYGVLSLLCLYPKAWADVFMWIGAKFTAL
ncbi:hypothetical protein [Agrobacterium larrymoorei]|uniref:Uncharacterized protein n=1 Tax=Agrobacterium larrymoorei TaxID=160699 RepID=A0A4D7E0F7_9HYPH|nr:hypothetical protein [Agrobacterium larrymoorei]QCJ01008.1 hypothetical protein CFBP5473_23900 [Agrobacterium larrymoorei]QYA10344.1 hypothetical protein J5285_22565 [Agrobacterium larrymoorei]